MWLLNLLVFIAILSVLIITHECGHFIAARSGRIKVERFAIGFGPVVFKKKVKETLFMLCAIPLGGYVKMAGDERTECKGEPYEFLSKSVGMRAKVVFFGPFFNFLLSLLILWTFFMIGIPQIDLEDLEKAESVVGEVIEGTPAEKAGLKAQDKIIEINGIKVTKWKEVPALIQESSKDVTIVVVRNGEVLTFVIEPRKLKQKDMFGREKEQKRRHIGIAASVQYKIVKYNPITAFFEAFKKIGMLMWMILKGFYYIFTGQIPARDAVAGPIGLYQITATIAQKGFLAILNLVAVLGVTITVVNLFPVPILDGGHIFLLGLEKIRKRPLTEKVENALNRMGAILLTLLILFVFYNDILRLITR